MVTNDQLFAFNHDQIEKICYKGYVTDNYKDISRLLNEGLEEIKKEETKPEEGQE